MTCVECGNDDATEGYELCSDCLEGCANCGHAALCHGDRAIVACDGDWAPPYPTQMFRNWEREGPGPVCICPGWKAVEVILVT